MNTFTSIINRISRLGAGIAGLVLIGIMALTVANVILRLFGEVIVGTYEIIELSIVITVAFALGYTALQKGHVVVRIVVSRFPKRIQAIAESFTTLIGLVTCLAIAWASYIILQERWLAERSNTIMVPFFPFRIIWQCGLILFCLVLLIDLIRVLSQAVRK